MPKPPLKNKKPTKVNKIKKTEIEIINLDFIHHHHIRLVAGPACLMVTGEPKPIPMLNDKPP